MSLGVQNGNSTQALVEDVVMGAYQAKCARVSALVMLLWDHGNLMLYILALYLLTTRCVVTCLDREVELVWVCLGVSTTLGPLN